MWILLACTLSGTTDRPPVTPTVARMEPGPPAPTLVATESLLEIPAGARVVVAAGARVERPGGGWSAVPRTDDVGWPAEVVGDDGGLVRVRLAEHGCAAPLFAAAWIDAPFVVREADLVTLAARDTRGAERGDEWFVGAGEPIREEHGALVFFVDGIEVELPAGSVPLARFIDPRAPGTSEPQPRTEKERLFLRPAAGAWGTFAGRALRGPTGVIEGGAASDGRVTVRSACAAVTFRAADAVPVDANGDGIWDFMPPHCDRHWLSNPKPVPTPVALSWLDGGPAGLLRAWDGLPPVTELRGDLVCMEYELAACASEPRVSLCGRWSDLGLPFAPSMGVPPADAIVSGGLDARFVAGVMERHRPELDACYARTEGSHGGRVTLRFRVAEDGAVSLAKVKASTLERPAVEACLEERVRGLRFLAPSRGMATVTWPLDFED